MSSLAFRVIWLMGVVAGGGPAAARAREVLGRMSTGLVADQSRMLALLYDGLMLPDRALFIQAFSQLAGVEFGEKETSMDAIERATASAEMDYALRRAVLDTAMMASPVALAERLEELAKRLRTNSEKPK